MSEPTSADPGKRLGEILSSLWWMPLLRGILLVFLGAYALFRPGLTAIALTQVVGIFVSVDGVLAIVAGILGETPSRGWTMVRGVLLVLVGTFVFGHPIAVAGITATLVLYVIAFGAIASGILEVMAAIRDRQEIKGEGWLILSGVLSVVFGLVLVMAPLAFGALIIRILGAYAIIFGGSLIALALRLRKLGKTQKA